MNALAAFNAGQIMKQAKVSTQAGRDKYTAYFVSTRLYAAYRAEVDEALIEEGEEDVVMKQYLQIYALTKF